MLCASSSPTCGIITHFTPQSALPRKIKKQKTQTTHQQQQQYQQTLQRFKTKPTPLLLTNPNPQSQSKLEALESIIKDLEASINNGFDVADTQLLCALLETCYNLRAVEHGIRIHRMIPSRILIKNAGVGSKLVRLYAANGYLEEAHQVFDEMSERDECAFVWNSLISGYTEMGMYEDALAIYFQMEEEGVEIDRFTFPRVLKACGGLGLVQVGEEVHRHIVRYGFHEDGYVLNALVGMYAKCGNIVKARRVFERMRNKDLVSWNSMITGYFHHGLVREALSVFHGLVKDGFTPDEVSLSSILKGVSSVRIGGQIHAWILRRGLNGSLIVNNSLISLYSSQGKLEQARWLFRHMPRKDVTSWNSIISAHNKDPNALKYLQEMQSEGVAPDNITFVLLLSTCANLGLVSDGERLFLLMQNKYGIVPIMEHYASMVNLYGRAGMIVKAYKIVTTRMEFEAGPTVWGALLYACSLHNNAEVGEIAANKLFELEPDDEHNFELLMKIYEGLGRSDDVERVRKMMVDRGLDL